MKLDFKMSQTLKNLAPGNLIMLMQDQAHAEIFIYFFLPFPSLLKKLCCIFSLA